MPPWKPQYRAAVEQSIRVFRGTAYETPLAAVLDEIDLLTDRVRAFNLHEASAE